MAANDPLLAPIPDAEHRDFGGVQLDIVRTGSPREAVDLSGWFSLG